jgi:hypothetical protein
MSSVHLARSCHVRFLRTYRTIFLLICSVTLALNVVAAKEPDQPDQLRLAAHLAAGEFGPATELAQSAADPVRRDAMLTEIAQAQANVGARTASLHTALSIRGDRARTSAFEHVKRVPAFAGARGGAALADFDSLIDLITATVAPTSWDLNGGTGAIESFAGGVYVDTSGTLQRLKKNFDAGALLQARRAALGISGNRDARQKSDLRKVSLTRLERMAQMRWAAGQQPDEQMQVLAGLTRIQYLFVFPDTGDIVLAGPAEDWEPEAVGAEMRIVGRESRKPVLLLDDLVVVLRNALAASGRFGCSINPRQEQLASVQHFLNESSQRSLRPGEREKWLRDLRDRLGQQDIEVRGIDPRTRAARVLVEADYRMKLVGMGLEPGTLGVTGYLESIVVPPGSSPPPLDVLRWWFTLNYDVLKATQAHDAFEIVGPGVKVLSENELLTERGERVHTGNASNANRMFTQSFTKQFADLATKYPIYAELRNIFDLAMVSAVIREEDLGARCGCEFSFFGPRGSYQVALGDAPKQVDSVINHRVVDRKHILVGVSGGVAVDTNQLVKSGAIKTDTYRLLSANRTSAAPPALPVQAWWWD